MNAASQGDAALAKSDFVSALQHYTRALVELPRAPAYYIKRSTAYVRLKPADGGPNLQGALRDAEIALSLSRERAKRDLILAAQMRRAVALYQMERYGDAGFLLELLEEKVLGDKKDGAGAGDVADKVKDVMGGSKSTGPARNLSMELPIWLIKIRGKLGGLGKGDERGVVTVEEFPVNVKVPSEKELKKQLEGLKAGKIVGGEKVQGGAGSTGEKVKDEAIAEVPKENKAPAAATLPEKVRHEWYQSNDSVVVTLYVKGVPKDSVDAELKSDSVSVQFPLPSGSEYAFNLDPLYAPIDESSSKISAFATKIELVLRKQTPGQKWSSLESTSTDIKPTTPSSSAPAPPIPASGPSYPTSSRHGAKDWDKLASTLTAKKPKKPKQSESHSHSHSHGNDEKCTDNHHQKPEGEKDHDSAESDNEGSVDSDIGGDPVDGFFKKLYAGADDDTRRAMVKSFVESNGTSLSTNWGDVGKGKVNPYPASD
ncbi:SGT1 and CS domain protein [Aspergillus cavernicola]|uniref:SGT1 and CS domain protein n=1 Tax=Aspergillus cavernicola TaxID=176166 RepID=A0ABR4IDS9_9EURO